MSTKKYTNEDSFTSSGSDDFREIFLSASSHDRSSVGSIPWAEDAIKQNQQEWERVERMFYGEEDLPEEPLLRNEIIEWNKAFPHLRVKGIKLDSNDAKSKLEFSISKSKEEIFVIHPLPLRDSASNNIRLIKLSARSTGPPERNQNIDELGNFLENDLRISSVPMMSKQAPNVTNSIHKKSFKNLTQNTTNIRQIIPSKSSGSLLLHKKNLVPIIKSSNSASYIRMPPILLFPTKMRVPSTSSMIKQTSANIVKRNQIVLPAINLNRVEFNVDNAAKSARTVNQNERKPPTHLPFSASKLHFFK